VVPVIAFSSCERTEKERIVRLDAYSLTVAFTVPEWPGGERNCYAYASSAATALRKNPALGGAASRAELTVCAAETEGRCEKNLLYRVFFRKIFIRVEGLIPKSPLTGSRESLLPGSSLPQ
jgi:hypothetical protein